eukprot:scaffold152_cov383-Prasinococcus_capsulatus_cf.AAC.1
MGATDLAATLHNATEASPRSASEQRRTTMPIWHFTSWEEDDGKDGGASYLLEVSAVLLHTAGALREARERRAIESALSVAWGRASYKSNGAGQPTQRARLTVWCSAM